MYIYQGASILFDTIKKGNINLKSINSICNQEITDISAPYLIEIIKRIYITDINLSIISRSGERQKEIS